LKPLFIILALPLITLGCGRSTPAEVALHPAVGLENGFAELRLVGLVANAEPEGHQPEIPWVPLDEAAPEGARAKPGDELVTLNRSMLTKWSIEEELVVRHRQASLDLVNAKASHEISQLEEERSDLDRTRRVLNARIEATRQQDAVEISILRTQVEQAEQAVQHAERRKDRLEILEAQGIGVHRELLDARDEYDNATEALRIPQDELDFLLSLTGATTRKLLELERGAVEVDLGSPQNEHGVFGAMTTRRRKQDLDATLADRDLRRHERRLARLNSLTEDNALRAVAEGVVRHREWGLNTGDSLNSGSAIFILREEDMGFEFDLPARWRNVVEAAGDEQPESGRVFVDVPQLGLLRLAGRIRSVAARPYDTRHGRAYRCRIELDEPAPGLLEGLQVDCMIRVEVPRNAVAIPAWTVSDPHDPQVTMADGTQRMIEGQLIGHRFIVTGGLTAGEQVRAIPHREEFHRERLEGVVESRSSIDLRVPWRVEIVDMVPEGSYVEKGSVIAHAASTRGRRGEDRLQEAEYLEQKAEAEFEVARMEAEAEMSEAFAAWQKERLNLDDARLRYLVQRYGSLDGEVAADVEFRKASTAVRAAERNLAEKEAAAPAGTVSAQQLRAAQLEARKSRLLREKAELQAVATLNSRDWVEVWDRRAASYEAEEEAAVRRSDYSVKREQFHLAMARATDQYQATLAEARRLRRRVERLTLKAPHDGRVYYHFDSSGRRRSSDKRPLKVGRRLRTTAPFYMPEDTDRRVRIEVPMRFHGAIGKGREVSVRTPVLGSESVPGTVVEISHNFHESKLDDNDFLLSETVGTPPRVFTVLVDLHLLPQQADRVKPGVTAWMEIGP